MRIRLKDKIKGDLREISCEDGRWLEVGSLLGTCLMAGFGISSVEHSDSTSRESVSCHCFQSSKI
jgi:hypothetical protein